MKKIIYIYMLLLNALVWGQSNDHWNNTFDKANELYQKENFQEAIKLYQQLIEEKNNSPELYFNLANAYFQTKSNTEAVYYYEKALKLSPDDKSIETNLNFARKKLEDDITIIKEYDRKDILHQSLYRLTSDGWAKLATFSAIGIFLIFVIFYLNQNGTVKRICFGLMGLGLLLIIGSIYAAKFEQSYANRYISGIVFDKQIEMKEEAKSTSNTIRELHSGAKVYILENKSLWIKVRLDNQEEGWIEKKSIREI